jgi:hypothetical protein
MKMLAFADDRKLYVMLTRDNMATIFGLITEKLDSSSTDFKVKLELIQALDIILRDHEIAREDVLNDVSLGKIEISTRHLEDSIPGYFAANSSYLESLHRLKEKISNKDDSEVCLNLRKYLIDMINYLEDFEL